MRPSFPHPLREQRHTRRRRRGHGPRSGETATQIPPAGEAPLAALTAPPTAVSVRSCDPAAQRVREAGGPVDHASYVCSCGYLFSASVSTSVSCPHCGSGQAW
jgi:hypothetical protein